MSVFVSELRVLAERQRGLFTVHQAAAYQVTQKALLGATERGLLRRVRRGVYAFSGTRASAWEPTLAASLAAGGAVSPGADAAGGARAVISHRSAAAVHGLAGIRPGKPELTMARGTGAKLEGVLIHRPRRELAGVDLEVRAGVAVTTPLRTLCDLPAVIGSELLVKVLDEGAIARHWTYPAVLRTLDRIGTSGTPGGALLRQL
ncbi:MAG: type IV toxin-antitoxin system AbiEi family antitoxin domain-containing protein, partial [Actinomycetota bacterium]|nr:type IV toxin-antitoxin system AbiEi family antitoxin domain-containing protein [Actinomycetota bacterium]